MEKFKIIEERENPLFRRKEIRIGIDSEVSPNRAEILNLISEKFSVPESHVQIRKVQGKFGAKSFTIEANIYSSEKEKTDVELKKKKDTKEKK